jgi:hypothetical protein
LTKEIFWNDTKGRFYEELEHVFDKFPKYNMKILLGDFSSKVGREYIFKTTTWNKSLQENSNVNGDRVVNFATSKITCEPNSPARLTKLDQIHQ